jgi:transcriptional regulator with GAF, ATPase, and Fis domain
VGAERGFIVLRPGLPGTARLELRAARSRKRARLTTPERQLSRSIVAQVLAQGESLVLESAADHPSFREVASVRSQKLRSVICCPLLDRSEVLGAIYLDNRFAIQVYHDEHRRLLEVFSAQAALSLAQAQRRPRGRAKLGEPEPSSTSALVGVSAAMVELRALIRKLAVSDAPVLISGETGTGKELAARALHSASPRRARRLVTLNCAELSPELIESTLFGHLKHSWTGAERAREGLFQRADKGTLFLDEVSELPLALQAKLLRVLQEGELRPIGSDQVRAVDVRVIAASNRRLASLVERGSFRADLFYRLSVLPLELPPLRDRREDISLLCAHFLEVLARKHGLPQPRQLCRSALSELEARAWPGNVRELRGAIERAHLISDGQLERRDFRPFSTAAQYSLEAPPRESTWATRGAPKGARSTARRTETSAREPGDLTLSISELEQRAIEEAVLELGGPRPAALALGLHPSTVYRKLKRYQEARAPVDHLDRSP